MKIERVSRPTGRRRVAGTVTHEQRESIRNLVSEQRGRRFVLDCGHMAILGDGRSNTIVIFPDGTAKCHNCTY